MRPRATTPPWRLSDEPSSRDTTARSLNLAIYFANPYRSCECGSNENTNGLLRQYPGAPGKTDFRTISHHALASDTRKLNNRPRERLHYRTPAEVLRKARGVALQI